MTAFTKKKMIMGLSFMLSVPIYLFKMGELKMLMTRLQKQKKYRQNLRLLKQQETRLMKNSKINLKITSTAKLKTCVRPVLPTLVKIKSHIALRVKKVKNLQSHELMMRMRMLSQESQRRVIRQTQKLPSK